MNNTRKLTLTSILIAMNIVLSQIISIPIGPIKAFPMQHFINVLCAVFVGPWYGLAQALISSVLRNIFGTGIIGSICTIPMMFVMNIDLNSFMPIFYAFLINSFIGSMIAYFLLKLLDRRNLLNKRNG